MIKGCLPDSVFINADKFDEYVKNSRQNYIEQPGYKKPAITEPALKARNMNNRG
jgi:hypothetical protein